MNILHVSLGLPPLRTGGLNRYCYELMQSQIALGHNVSLLFPGKGSSGHPRIKVSSNGSMTVCELLNPLPVALTYGVDEPLSFISACSETIYADLLDSLSPDIIHVHSFMGIHKEFFKQVRKMGIQMVFTTHDFYPICLRCTFVDFEGAVCFEPNSEKCAKCNYGKAISSAQNRIMQTNGYALLKRSRLFVIAKRVAKKYMVNRATAGNQGHIPSEVGAGYRDLLSYNDDILNSMSMLLCNSKTSYGIYDKYYPEAQKMIMPITHEGLSGACRKKNFSPRVVLGYAGGRKSYKGLDVLLESLNYLDKDGIDWHLHLYGDDYAGLPEKERVKHCGTYSSCDVNSVLSSVDIMIVPSICPETFGFVVLESLCAGTPVICSDAVGSKDLLPESWVFRSGDPAALAFTIERLLESRFVNVCVPEGFNVEMKQHAEAIQEVYSKCITKKSFRD